MVEWEREREVCLQCIVHVHVYTYIRRDWRLFYKYMYIVYMREALLPACVVVTFASATVHTCMI